MLLSKFIPVIIYRNIYVSDFPACKKVFECEVLEHNLGKSKEFYGEHVSYYRLAKSDI